jgi:hypothetical protein
MISNVTKKNATSSGRLSPFRALLHRGFVSSRKRRVFSCLAVAVLGAGGLIAWSAPSAFACGTDEGDACYAIANAVKADLAVYGEVYLTCNYVPNNSTFVTNEIWDGDSAGDAWTEAGVFTGYAYNHSAYYSKTWFWADERPNEGYNEWPVSGASPTTNTYYPVEIQWAGNNTWDIYGGNSTGMIGQSTSQPLTSSGSMDAGTEYTAPSGTGMRNVGKVGSLQYESIQDAWYSWGTLGKADADEGPGGYVTPVYSPSASQVTWNGPC